MAVSRFVTAGVALATAGAIAAIPAIAPPLEPRDIAVVNDTRVQLSADITDLINTFFNELPGNADAPGTVGVPGVIYQLLLNANEGDQDAQDVLDAFFGSGASEVVRLLLTRDNADPITRDQINAFFGGGLSELVRYRLLLFNGDATQRDYINTFFGGAVDDAGDPNNPQIGVPGVFYKWLSGTGLSQDQQEALDIFFNRGVLTDVNDTPADPTDDVYVGSSNPAYFGFSGLAYRAIKTSGLTPDQHELVDDFFDGGASLVVKNRLLASTADPGQINDINAFFDSGIAENFRWRLVDGAPDQRSKDLWNEFFDNGVTGVVRYLLVGPAPQPAPIAPVTTLAKAAGVEETVDPVVTKTDPVESTAGDTKKVAAVTAPVAPAPEPVKSTSSVKEKAADEEEAADAVKDGNKVEPVILLPGEGKGPKAGEGGFGVFGEIAGAIGRFVTGTGSAPATTPTTDTETSTEGGTDG